MSGHSLDFCPSSCTHSVQILIWGWRENSTAPMLMTRQQPVEFTSLFVVFQVFAVSSFICKLIYGDKLQKVLICYWFPGCWTTRVTKKISLKNEMTRKLGCRKGTLEYKIRKFIHFVLTWVCSVFDQTCLTFFLTCAQIWILWRGVDYGRRSFDPPPPPLSLWIHCHIVFFGCVIWWPVPLSRALTFGCVPKSGAMNSVWLWNGSRLKILLDRTNGLLGITGETPQSSHTEKCICTESTNTYATQKVQETTIIWDVVPSIFRVSIFVGCFSVSTFVNTKINQKYTEKQHETFSNVVAN